MTPFRLFAVTLPGLEPYTRQELTSLGMKVTSAEPESDAPASSKKEVAGEQAEEAGGVEFEGEWADLYRANLYLRTANRVLLRLGDFYASAFSELRKKAARLPWELALQPGQPVAVRVTCHRSKLYHSDGVAERVAGGIGDHLGMPSPLVPFDEKIQPLPALVVVRLSHDHCTISLDTSGALLHRRGYRLETAKAPLRENIAAGILLASGWDQQAPLIDPFCGSGTIPIEAALLARNIAPGRSRAFAFTTWPDFDAGLWQGILAAAKAAEHAVTAPIFGSDRDAGAIRISQDNAERAGVADSIQFTCQAFSSMQPPEQKGWIVTNPPYGIRVSAQNDLRNLYAQLGKVLQLHCLGWQAHILCSSDYLIGHAHLGLQPSLWLVNGGIPVRVYSGSIFSR